ncbi:MAG: GatB/YqeY domain-containing protein [Candidatus Buchananbacteria bacterium]|nr:GatB/YqeY domain-containing protein [Candidatus Buchananbacteria bacterium]
MDIIQQISQDLNQALKEKNELAVLTLRQVRAAISNAEIANSREKLTDEQIVKILKTEVKKRKESIELFTKGNRPELAKKEAAEVEIVSRYLPPEMSEEQVSQVIDSVIGSFGAVGPKDMGKVIGQVMAKLAGQADGSVVSRLIKEKLQS